MTLGGRYWICLALTCSVLLGACSLLLDDAPDAASDAGGDARPDGETGPDADSEEVDGDDGDADGEGDGDGEGEDGGSGTITAITATAVTTGPYPAATSVIIDLEPTWEGERREGARVEIRSEGGLVSLPLDYAAEPSLSVPSAEDGSLPSVRLTFPLDPWPYDANLSWRRLGGGPAEPVGGDALFRVVEPTLREAVLPGTSDSLVLPDGLAAEEYALVGGAFDHSIPGGGTALESLAFTWEVDSSELVVSGGAQSCFFPSHLASDCIRTRPEVLEDQGPDSMEEVVFYPSEDSARGLYGAALAQDGNRWGGLFRIDRGGTVTRLVDRTNMRAVHPEAGENRFRPTDGPGLYFTAEGQLHHLDPVGGGVTNPCPDYGVYLDSIVVGDPDIYGPFLFGTRREGSAGRCWLERIQSSCGGEEVFDFDTSSARHLRASPGMVFGRTIYVLHVNEIALLLPDPATGLTTAEIIDPAWPPHLVNLAFMPAMNGLDHHPPGLYVLEEPDEAARIIRIFQDLTE